MTDKFSGRCSCGEISYGSTAKPKFSLFCQCRQCQRITGTGHSAQFAIEAKNTTIKGNVKSYGLTADSGNDVIAAFCGTCGNPMYKTTSAMPGMLVFHAATLDNPALFEPQMLVNASSAQPWDSIDPTVKRAE